MNSSGDDLGGAVAVLPEVERSRAGGRKGNEGESDE